MIYVPEAKDYKCVVVQNATTLRAYYTQPQRNTTVSYRDYYYTSHYTYTEGTQTYGNTATLPTCLSSSEITSDFYYRTDFDSILVIFLIMSIFCILIPLKIISRFCKRWR